MPASRSTQKGVAVRTPQLADMLTPKGLATREAWTRGGLGWFDYLNERLIQIRRSQVQIPPIRLLLCQGPALLCRSFVLTQPLLFLRCLQCSCAAFVCLLYYQPLWALLWAINQLPHDWAEQLASQDDCHLDPH